MDQEDSDSSIEDTIPYSETNVNLGYASKEPTGDTISHLGGFPTWLDSIQLPSATLGRCRVCESTMSLLLLLNTDLPEHFPNDERRLHIFACRRRSCSRKVGSIRALREVRKHKADQSDGKQGQKASAPQKARREAEEPDRKQGHESAAPPAARNEGIELGNTLFGATSLAPDNIGKSNPFSPASTARAPSHSAGLPSTLPCKPHTALTSQQSMQEPLAESFASKLRVSTPASLLAGDTESEPWPPDSSLPKPFPYLHLDAEYEALVSEGAYRTKATSSTAQFLDEDAINPNGLDKDLFESSLDKTFVRFSDRLAQNPEQVLRYEWKGTPLLYSRTDAVGKRLTEAASKVSFNGGMPACERCGSQRVLEVQLVPGTITALEEEIDLEESMEWGTIVIGVCERNCGEIGQVVFREEWCGVQWEDIR